MKNTISVPYLTILFSLFFCCIAFSPLYAQSGTATQTISTDGLTSTWTNFTVSTSEKQTYSTSGLYIVGKVTSSSNVLSLTVNTSRILYLQVPSQNATGSLSVKSSQTNADRKLKLVSGSTIEMNTNGASANFTASDVVAINNGYYIKLVANGGECKMTEISVSLTNAANGTYGGGENATDIIKYCISVYNTNGKDSMYTFAKSATGTNKYEIVDFVIPQVEDDKIAKFWVGENNAWASAYSENKRFDSLRLEANTNNLLGKYTTGAVGTLYIDDSDKTVTNLNIVFAPKGYGFCWGQEGVNWNTADYLPFTKKADEANKWATGVIALTAENFNWSYYVGLEGDNGYKFSSTRSHTYPLTNVGTMGADGNITSTDLNAAAHTGQRGRFEIWDNSADSNWYVHFVPYFALAFDKRGGTMTDVTYEYAVSAGAQTVVLPSISKDGYVFTGWYKNGNKVGGVGDNYTFTPTANETLTAGWKEKWSYILYNEDGTVFSTADNAQGDATTFPMEEPKRTGHNFLGWTRTQGGTDVVMAAGGAYTFWKVDDKFYPVWEVSNTTCLEKGTTDYGTFVVTANPWNSSTKRYELKGSATPLKIQANEGYYIASVEFDIESSSDNQTFEFGWGVKATEAISIGKTRQTISRKNTDETVNALVIQRNGSNVGGTASGTRYIYSLCVEVLPIPGACTDSAMVWSADSVVIDYTTLTKGQTIAGLPTITGDMGQALVYASSNDAVATIGTTDGVVTFQGAMGETTIQATRAEFTAGDGKKYCEAVAQYVLSIAIPAAKQFGVTLSSPNIDTETCYSEIILKVTTTNVQGTATYQWYKDDVAIDGATADTIVTSEVGVYKALVTANGYQQWTKKATIAKNAPDPKVEALSDRHLYRKGCSYLDVKDVVVRHLCRVKSWNTLEDGSRWTVEVKNASADVETAIANAGQIVYEDPAEANVLLLDMRALAVADSANNLLAIGDEVKVKVTPVDGCGVADEGFAKEFIVRVVGKDVRNVAYVISGGNKDTVVLNGDFFEGYNKYDLKKITGGTMVGGIPQAPYTWSETEDDPLWAALQASANVEVTPVNGYAPYNPYNYESFDLILLTDFVKTNVQGYYEAGDPVKKTAKVGVVSLNELAHMVDVKPILTLKSHLANEYMANWKLKGFESAPVVPKTTKLDMDLLCVGHSIFYNGSSVNTSDTLNVLSAPGFDKNKALQGFMARDAEGFVNVATIVGGQDTLLVSCCERQVNLEARMLVLCVNAQAQCNLTLAGTNAILNAVAYLLGPAANTDDCSIIFDNNEGQGDGLWSNPNNWNTKKVPTKAQNIHIHADCTVDIASAAAAMVKINPNNKLTINAGAALILSDEIGICDLVNNYKINPMTSTENLYIKADANGSGAIIPVAQTNTIKATVDYYSKASGAPNNCQWQWVTTPLTDGPKVGGNLQGAWVYEWSNEAHAWNKILTNGDAMRPFGAYSLTQVQPHTYVLKGDLVGAMDQVIGLKYDEVNQNGINLVGNSWTAPIHIGNFVAADFVNCEASVILFNTGLDPEGDGTISNAVDNTMAGQYVSIPVNTVSTLPENLHVIPALNAFQINATGAGASLNLNYQRLMFCAHGVNIQPMRTAARNTSGAKNSGITETMVIRVEGSNFADVVRLYKNEDCTFGFDNGWDGTKMLGDLRAPQLFVEYGQAQWAVSTQPTLIGTQLGFYRGEDSFYTIHIGYDGSEEMYLYDAVENRYVDVVDGMSYSFYSTTDDLEHRFMLTQKETSEPQGPTTDVADVAVDGEATWVSNMTGEAMTVRVYDAAGKLISEEVVEKGGKKIALPETKGVYLIDARNTKAHVTRKVVQ